MAQGAKVGDMGSDHDGFPPTPITSGSPTVKFDGIPAARVGDPLTAHDKPKHPPHPRTISSGSSTVMIDGKPAAMSGCSISCGGVVNVGGGTVNIGDGPGGTAASAPVKPLAKIASRANQSASSVAAQHSADTSNVASASNAVQAESGTRTIKMNPDTMYWPEYGLSKEVKVVYEQETVKLAVLAPDEWKAFFDSLDAAKTVKDTVSGLYNARETAKALGGLGAIAFIKEVDGVEYLILKDYDKWKQTLLHGGVFKANNEQVVKLGLGVLDSAKGMVRYVKISAPLEILIGSAINVLQFIVNDEYTLRKLGVDEAKILTNTILAAGLALVWAEAAPLYAATVVGSRVILVISNALVWGVDKVTNFSEKIVKEVMDNFDD
ncbi:PAAR motif protein [Vibrio spartinae]|uniref:PAAR motif protein n=1 Tax=Vibrio spartinae TaxID=1918945 RepID=A0A1N6MB64_9VIBR|nr:PAAR motif protein [Vibrio spartinae]